MEYSICNNLVISLKWLKKAPQGCTITRSRRFFFRSHALTHSHKLAIRSSRNHALLFQFSRLRADSFLFHAVTQKKWPITQSRSPMGMGGLWKRKSNPNSFGVLHFYEHWRFVVYTTELPIKKRVIHISFFYKNHSCENHEPHFGVSFLGKHRWTKIRPKKSSWFD